MLRGALATAGCLAGGLVAGGVVGDLVHSAVTPFSSGLALALAVLTSGLFICGGGAIWARTMGRLAGATDGRRMAWSGAVGFGIVVIVVGLGLNGLERLVGETASRQLGIHHLYTLLFVPATLVVAGVGGYALGLGLRDRRLGARLARWGGLAAAVSFLVVDLAMDAAGWRVGAPGAVRRATMMTVTGVSALIAALVSGAILGRLLSDHRARPS